MLPAAAALFSSAVPVVRLPEANFGMSARVMTSATRPLPVKITLPFASDPYGSVLVPPWSRTLDFIVQAPTTCCLSEPFLSLPPWAADANSAAAANAKAVLQMVFMANSLAASAKCDTAGEISPRPGQIDHRIRAYGPPMPRTYRLVQSRTLCELRHMPTADCKPDEQPSPPPCKTMHLPPPATRTSVSPAFPSLGGSGLGSPARSSAGH